MVNSNQYMSQPPMYIRMMGTSKHDAKLGLIGEEVVCFVRYMVLIIFLLQRCCVGVADEEEGIKCR